MLPVSAGRVQKQVTVYYFVQPPPLAESPERVCRSRGNGLGCGEEDLMSFGGVFWGDGVCSLRDAPSFIPEDMREKNMKEVRRVTRAVRKAVFPIHGIKI